MLFFKFKHVMNYFCLSNFDFKIIMHCLHMITCFNKYKHQILLFKITIIFSIKLGNNFKFTVSGFHGKCLVIGRAAAVNAS